jgi:hypothetical protein
LDPLVPNQVRYRAALHSEDRNNTLTWYFGQHFPYGLIIIFTDCKFSQLFQTLHRGRVRNSEICRSVIYGRTMNFPKMAGAWTALLALAALTIAPPAHAQAQSPQRASALPEPALDRLAAPIALYPDVLLAQLLMASTYPLDVAEAARRASRQSASTPAAISRGGAGQRWENSVRALLPFAPILTMMSNEKNWTRQLAAVVNDQPAALLDTIQMLRERAYDNGALHSAAQQQVQRQDRIIRIEPAETHRIYVPYYDPAQVYAAAGNSLLPPQYWAAQPFAAPQSSAGNGIVFSTGIDIADRAFYDARIDWRTGRLLLRRTTIDSDTVSTGAEEWRHDPQYRKRSKPASGTVGTDAAVQPGVSIGTRDADMPSPAPGGVRISTRRPQPDDR